MYVAPNCARSFLRAALRVRKEVLSDEGRAREQLNRRSRTARPDAEQRTVSLREIEAKVGVVERARVDRGIKSVPDQIHLLLERGFVGAGDREWLPIGPLVIVGSADVQGRLPMVRAACGRVLNDLERHAAGDRGLIGRRPDEVSPHCDLTARAWLHALVAIAWRCRALGGGSCAADANGNERWKDAQANHTGLLPARKLLALATRT
jgi:hypothetical protein